MFLVHLELLLIEHVILHQYRQLSDDPVIFKLE